MIFHYPWDMEARPDAAQLKGRQGAGRRYVGCDLPHQPLHAWRAQIVHVKPPPDTPSSGPGRAVGRGQEVNLRSVPGSRPSTSGHRRTHPHPPKQPTSASPALRHPFPVLGEL
ncbi:PREDICTED: uncharacterized protein LOC109485425 isoform X1 [Branchiostoma belcheri]|uniref:Uncharacterized protein LOC109485425 isoform X1 n=1 Tax=Branchiostoma belcheri TaxID=7741 RepID=A0A6P5ARD3_BRABE|nr:PREDICTED: uncharacterized protein LOC109485425 isoform X1 [Branchiostoma belcheri]